jgi:hypothetical protein
MIDRWMLGMEDMITEQRVMPFNQSIAEHNHCAFIFDYMWWTHEEDSIVEWCDTHTPGWQREGMILSFANDLHRTLFLLRWQ